MSVEQLGALFVALVAAVAYLRWDVRRHPWAKCWRCDGKGKHWSLLAGLRFGDCRVCGGSGKRRGFLPWLLRVDVKKK